MKEAAAELLARSGFAAFKKTNPYFLYHRQAVGLIRKIEPQSIVDVNPFLGHNCAPVEPIRGCGRRAIRCWRLRPSISSL